MQKKEAIGVAGAITLLMGVFFPIWEMPGRGDISLYEYDKGVALFTILMAILIMILVTRLKCKFVGTLNTITLFIIMDTYTAFYNTVNKFIAGSTGGTAAAMLSRKAFAESIDTYGWSIVVFIGIGLIYACVTINKIDTRAKNKTK